MTSICGVITVFSMMLLEMKVIAMLKSYELELHGYVMRFVDAGHSRHVAQAYA